MSIIALNKKEGETPLECIERARKNGAISVSDKATYAGRLDPMASGVLVVLTSEDVHSKDTFLNLGKVYEVEVLFGVSTDTADILGLVAATSIHEKFDKKIVENAADGCVGRFVEEYPKYSSRPVDGKPLFAWARELIHKDAPTHNIEIIDIEVLEVREIEGHQMLRDIEERVERVSGDFRQSEIVEKWKEWALMYGGETFEIARIRVSCGSGAYMRVLAEKIGATLGVPALAYTIRRVKVGDYTIV